MKLSKVLNDSRLELETVTPGIYRLVTSNGGKLLISVADLQVRSLKELLEADISELTFAKSGTGTISSEQAVKEIPRLAVSTFNMVEEVKRNRNK